MCDLRIEPRILRYGAFNYQAADREKKEKRVAQSYLHKILDTPRASMP